MEKIFAIVRMAVKPGEAEAFKQKAGLGLEAACTDLAGTQAYEWFLTPDGSECTVIEIYDGPEALAAHGRAVGKAMPSLLQHISMEMTFAGDVAPELLEQMRKRLGKAEYAGRRFLGRLRDAAPGAISDKAGSRIFALARFSVQPGHESAFKQLAQECFAAVEANEPGTLAYEWFLNDAGTECLTLDIYSDAAALGAHIKNVGGTMKKILGIVSSEVRMFGALPAEMQAKLNQGLGTRFVAPQFQGVF